MSDHAPCLNCSRERIEITGNWPKPGDPPVIIGYRVHCLDCGLAGPRGDTRQEAVRNWNRLYEDFRLSAADAQGREPIGGGSGVSP